jgi:hypothetical protein
MYRRERSKVWQCRFKVDGGWHRATTGEREYEKAKAKADRLRIAAEIRKESNLPVVTRQFRDVARLAIQRMNEEQASNQGKISYSDYIRVINDYLIPILGKHHITSIDSSVLDYLDAERIKQMGKAPSKSTLQTHNAALNRVFDEAVIRSFLTDANRPQLDAKGRESDRRPAFELKEMKAVLAKFEPWIERARTKKSKQLRLLLRDYVESLLDTGARPGKELLDLKWNQIKLASDPKTTKTDEIDPEDGEPNARVLQ